MAEFIRGMKPREYKLLTKTQRAYLWVGAFIAVFFQGAFCFFLGYLAHSINHSG